MSLRLIRFWIALLKDSPWLQGTSRQTFSCLLGGRSMATPKILSCLVTLRSYICPHGMETLLWDLGSKLIRSKDAFYPEFLTPFVKLFQFKGQGRQRERNPTHQSSLLVEKLLLSLSFGFLICEMGRLRIVGRIKCDYLGRGFGSVPSHLAPAAQMFTLLSKECLRLFM